MPQSHFLICPWMVDLRDTVELTDVRRIMKEMGIQHMVVFLRRITKESGIQDMVVFFKSITKERDIKDIVVFTSNITKKRDIKGIVVCIRRTEGKEKG